MIFRTISPRPYYSEPAAECNLADEWSLTAIAVDSRNARGLEPLFCAGDCRALAPRPVYPVGHLWGAAHAMPSDSSLVAYRFVDLGRSDGVATLALSVDSSRELARTKGGNRTLPGRIPASLSGQTGL